MTSDVEPGQHAIGERDRLVGCLTGLLQTATDEELEYIADAPMAGPIQTAKHRAALRTVIFKRNGRMNEKHAFFPGEAVSMVAEDGQEHIGRAFEIATALLMLNALLGDDADGAMSLCWGENWRVYPTVDHDFLEPLLLGFRWLAENATVWDYPHDPERVEPVPGRAAIAELVAGTQRTHAGIGRQAAPDGQG